MDMYKGMFMSLAARQTHLIFRDRWGSISEKFAAAFFNDLREGTGLNVLFSLSRNAVPFQRFVTQCMYEKMTNCGRVKLKNEPPAENRIVKAPAKVLYTKSSGIIETASRVWCDYLKQVRMTGEFVFNIEAIMSDDAYDDFSADVDDVTEFLMDNQIIATFGEDNKLAIPLTIGAAIKKMHTIIFKTPTIQTCVILARVEYAFQHILNVHVDCGKSYPRPERRVVVCPTEAAAAKVDPRHGYTTICASALQAHVRTPTESPLWGAEIVVIDSCHLFGIVDMANIGRILLLGQRQRYTAPALYLCGANAVIHSPDIEGAARMFCEMLSDEILQNTVNLMPSVTGSHVVDSLAAPITISHGPLLASRRLFSKMPQGIESRTRVSDSAVLSRLAAATLKALLATTDISKCIVLFDTVATRLAIESRVDTATDSDAESDDQDAAADGFGGARPSGIIARRDTVVEADGGQRRVINFYETLISGTREPIIMRDADHMYQPYIHYRLEGDPPDLFRHVTDHPITKPAFAVASKCHFAPARTVILVSGAPFLKQSDLDLAVYLAEHSLIVLCTPEFADSGYCVPIRPVEDSLWLRIADAKLKIGKIKETPK
jgi:hypothetical protein